MFGGWRSERVGKQRLPSAGCLREVDVNGMNIHFRYLVNAAYRSNFFERTPLINTWYGQRLFQVENLRQTTPFICPKTLCRSNTRRPISNMTQLRVSRLYSPIFSDPQRHHGMVQVALLHHDRPCLCSTQIAHFNSLNHAVPSYQPARYSAHNPCRLEWERFKVQCDWN